MATLQGVLGDLEGGYVPPPRPGNGPAGPQETRAAHTCRQVRTADFLASLDLTLRVNVPGSGTWLEEDSREEGGMTGCGSGQRFLQTAFYWTGWPGLAQGRDPQAPPGRGEEGEPRADCAGGF